MLGGILQELSDHLGNCLNIEFRNILNAFVSAMCSQKSRYHKYSKPKQM